MNSAECCFISLQVCEINSTFLLFRGPNGVWTLERKGIKPNINISFDEAVPTKTHMAIKKLVDSGIVPFVVSQNIDGLHLRSGIERKYIAELHGNMFTEQCSTCGK